MATEARIDKWLWSVRIYKTRTIACDACKKGRISINGMQCKPSKTVKEGDTVQVRRPPVTYTFKVLQPIENRVGAKLVPQMMENITPQDQYDLLEMNRIGGFVKRAAGLGRPTKKDRREMDDFLADSEMGVTEEFDFDE
ncbi:MAG: RNA-binding S4 domain-containing protein [Bacteroidaceae bacterium]|nr:RNA-binding S4 domain-containing protein [Bacteroidaceae bacterium]